MIPFSSGPALIEPSAGARPLETGELAVIATSHGDLTALAGLLGMTEPFRRIMMSRVYVRRPAAFCLAGPVTGAPYAAILLEQLVAWGVRRVIYLGWCGSLSAEVAVGDLLVPTAAIIEDGTSPAYGGKPLGLAFPSESLSDELAALLPETGPRLRRGVIWSTDAIYRETADKVAYFQSRDALAVEMELAALFTVSRFRGIETAAVLVVSDELHGPEWQPGFSDPRFQAARQAAADLVTRHVRRHHGG